MKHMIVGDCTHEVKVTFMKKIGYLINVIVNGKINQKAKAKTRAQVGPTIRAMLRMEDKCGNKSKMASRARYRHWEKQKKALDAAFKQAEQ